MQDRLFGIMKSDVAPGMGFEPMRTLRSTGSQGPRVNLSAIGMPNKCRIISVYGDNQCSQAVVFLYGIFYVKLSEKPSERCYAIMLMLTTALIRTVFYGDSRKRSCL